jgi:hypothetical protein
MPCPHTLRTFAVLVYRSSVPVESIRWELFSEQFYAEFFRRYPEDPVMFPGGRTSDARGCPFVPSADPEDEILPGWTLRRSPGSLRFYHKPTDEWIDIGSPIEYETTWRTDPRVHALVTDLGPAAASPGLWWEFVDIPSDTLVRTRTRVSGEDVEYQIDKDRLLDDLAAVARGDPPAAPSQFLPLFLDGTVKTYTDLRAYVKSLCT